MSGLWYEAIRFPNTNVMRCLNITVSSNTNNLIVALRYITIFNDERTIHNENLSFPLDTYTRNCIFMLKYDSHFVTYKMFEFNTNLILICGFSTISPIPLFKAFIRDRQITKGTLSTLKNFLRKYGILEFVYWTEQSPSECSTAVRLDDLWIVAMCSMVVAWILCNFQHFS